MKKLFLILIVLLILPTKAFSAPYLVCDLPPAGVEGVIVEADGILVPTADVMFTVNANDPNTLNLIDVESAVAGPHQYRARWIWSDASGWPGPGEWSSFLDVTKPGVVPGNLGVTRSN